MITWADRIRSKMKELGLTQEELAAKLSITRGAVTHYLAGRRVPPLAQFHKIAIVLKTTPAWLQFGVSDADSQHTRPISTKSNIPYKQVPILSWEQASKQNAARDIARGKDYEYLPNIFTDQSHWYALRVKGDAMTATSGDKSFYEGDIIIIDEEKKPVHGDFVIAVLPRTKELTFKQYVLDGGTEFLKPLNQQYPLTKIQDKKYIRGVITHNIACYTK
jgi:SOS-response transcriptional repressor LexA